MTIMDKVMDTKSSDDNTKAKRVLMRPPGRSSEVRVRTMPDGKRKFYECGRLTKVVFPNGHEQHYDKHRQLKKVVGTSGVVATFERGGIAHKRYPSGREKFYRRDGKLEKVVFPDGNVHLHDERGKLKEIIYSDGTKISYDKERKLYKYAFANGQVQFCENLPPRKSCACRSGDVEDSFSSSTKKKYTQDGNLKCTIYPDGLTLFYNEEGKVTEVLYPNGVRTFYGNTHQKEKVVYPNGREQIYTEDGVVVIYPNGLRIFFNKDKKIHREDGPAMIYPDGKERYYKDGVEYEP